MRWVVPGPDDAPTVLAFTGFGHRLDPWQRLRAPGWRVGVLEFPVGSPPTEVWTPEGLAEQLPRFWGRAARRVLMSFSFGAAGATSVGRVLARTARAPDATGLLLPHRAIHVAPVQWARIPWSILRRIPASARLPALKRLAKGGGALMALAGKTGDYGMREFVQLVDRHVGWDFVAFYLPYLDWIDPVRKTLATWSANPWPTHLIGATRDRVIPSKPMRGQVSSFAGVAYDEFDAAHFNAVDAARTEIFRLLALERKLVRA